MNLERELVIGFSDSEKDRIESHLARLIPHLTSEEFTIVGGLAIRHHLVSRGIPYPRRPFNDLDMVAESVDVVHPSVIKDFFVYHYHLETGGRFYVVLLDPISKTKIDIFDNHTPIEGPVDVNLRGIKVKITGIEGQLVKTVLDIQRISADSMVDPKQFLDTNLLLQIADIEEADRIWRQRNYVDYPSSIREAMERAEKIAQKHPEWLKEKPFRKPQPYVCKDCVDSDNLPLTPIEEIYEILGYIE